MMKRKIFGAMKFVAICIVSCVLILVLAAVFSGANGETETIPSNKDFEGFVIVSDQEVSNAGKGEYVITMYDSQTYVMYTVAYGGSFGNVSSVTPLYNEDGSLKIYDIPIEAQ